VSAGKLFQMITTTFENKYLLWQFQGAVLAQSAVIVAHVVSDEQRQLLRSTVSWTAELYHRQDQ